MNRVVFVSIIILCLLSVSSITGLIQIVKADVAPIYINADGSITPSTAPIYTADNITYTLTGNINITAANTGGIVIERDNIVLNGAGYTVTGGGNESGITTMTNISNVTVTNLILTNFTWGILLGSSSGNTFSGNTVVNNGQGIQLQSSSNNAFSGNTVVNNAYGIWLDSSPGNAFSDNTVVNNRYGIWLQQSSDNNTLSGNNVTASSNDGIVLSSASNNTLFGNNVTANSNIGILLESSYNCTLSGNNVANNGYGIKLYSASGDTLSGNNVVKNGNGIELYSSSDNMIYHNDFINNTSQVSSSNSTNIWDSGGLGNYWSDYLTKYPNATKVDGFGVWNTSYVIDANNTDYYPLMQLWVPYEGGPITINADGSISPSTAPITTVDNITYTFTANIIIESIVVQRDNIVLNGAGFTIQGDGTGNGIDLSNRNNITIENTNIENFQYGTFLENTSNNTISENNITANTYDGIYLYSSSNNSLNANNITGNNILGNSTGIVLESSSNNNNVSGNSVTSNRVGILFDSSSNNRLSGNNITNNFDGMYLYSSANNNLNGNNIAANTYDGIYLDSSSNNTIYHNNFINNTSQVSSSNSTNIWDSGGLGNYWSDYLTKYPNATETDGVWNTPYVIDTHNTDHYPLTVPIVVVPEFPWIQATMLFMLLTLLAAIIYKKKAVKTSQS